MVGIGEQMLMLLDICCCQCVVLSLDGEIFQLTVHVLQYVISLVNLYINQSLNLFIYCDFESTIVY